MWSRTPTALNPSRRYFLSLATRDERLPGEGVLSSYHNKKERGAKAPRSFLPAWAGLSVPVATEGQVGTRHVVAVSQRQPHACKRGCRQKEAQGAVVVRQVAVPDVLQHFHERSSAL